MLICDEQISMGAQNTGVMATITGWGETETNNYNGTLQVAQVHYIHIKLWLGSDRFGYDNGWIP